MTDGQIKDLALFQRLLVKHAHRIGVDTRGHFHDPACYAERLRGAIGTLAYRVRPEDAALAVGLGQAAGGPVGGLHVRIRGSSGEVCGKCGGRVDWRWDGGSLTAFEPCPHPDGYPPIVVEVNVPSGSMVFANDLRDVFRVVDGFDINTTPGEAECSRAYAAAGMAHLFVGNTCPGVYRLGEGSFVVGCPGYGRDGEETALPGGPAAEPVASVTTDLWWYSACDLDEFRRRAGREPDPSSEDVVPCRPGVYRFNHVRHRLADPDAWPAVFTEVEWVRPPDPVADLDAAYRDKDLTAGQVLRRSMDRYPSLHGGEDGVWSAVNHLLCVIGNGSETHPNGWVGYEALPDDAPEVSVPRFERAYPWYPLSGYSALAEGAGLADESNGLAKNTRFNPSFVDLSFNVVRSMLLYGVAGAAKWESDSQLRWAWHVYLGLKRLYPDRVPADCVDLPKPKVPKVDTPPGPGY